MSVYMSPVAPFLPPTLLKKAWVVVCLSGALWMHAAHADDYAEVNRLLKAGQRAEALAKADQYLSLKSRDPQMRFLKGVILAETGKSADAVAIFTKLTEDFPELPEPYNNLAVLYAGQSQFDKARAALEMAIRTNPSYATAHENLGDVYAKLASQAYSKALQLDGSNAGVPTKLALIRTLFAPDTKGKTPSPAAPTATVNAPAVKADAAAPNPMADKPTPAGAADATSNIEEAVMTWAKAWAAKDMKKYLAAYSGQFDPPGSKSRAAWEKERYARIVTKGSISVDVSDINVKLSGDKQAQVVFRQMYRSGSLESNSRKTLEMVQENGRWLIRRESTG